MKCRHLFLLHVELDVLLRCTLVYNAMILLLFCCVFVFAVCLCLKLRLPCVFVIGQFLIFLSNILDVCICICCAFDVHIPPPRSI